MPHEVPPEEAERFARAVGPPRDAVIEEIDEKVRREQFPTVGPAVGGWLQALAGMVGAERAERTPDPQAPQRPSERSAARSAGV